MRACVVEGVLINVAFKTELMFSQCAGQLLVISARTSPRTLTPLVLAGHLSHTRRMINVRTFTYHTGVSSFRIRHAQTHTFINVKTLLAIMK